jgi:hypothetical protein
MINGCRYVLPCGMWLWHVIGVIVDYNSFNISKNLHLYFEDTYYSMSLIDGNGPMVLEYLNALYKVIDSALNDYSRVFAFRVDLRLPEDHGYCYCGKGGAEVSRFVESFKAKVRHNREVAMKSGGLVHETQVRYFWVREVGDQGRVHFHLVVLLNGHAYNWLGNYQSAGGNMANRIWEAWASALGISVDEARTLVHFPVNPSYMLRRDDPESVAAFFQRASYLCKARTKHYGEGHHGYGASRT